MILEGTYHNPNTNKDETRCLVCDEQGRLILQPNIGSGQQTQGAGAIVQSYSFTNVVSGALVLTPVFDIGEDLKYTLLIARKIGGVSSGETLEIQTSVDGVVFAPAAGVYYETPTAWFSPPYPSVSFCVKGRPVGRYVRVAYVCGQDDQANLTINLVCFAGL